MIICHICNIQVKNIKGLSSHIRQKHKEIDSQKYYDMFLITNKKEKYCRCGNDNKFYSLGVGYLKNCSIKCSNNSIDRKNKISISHKRKTKEELEESNKKRKETYLKKYGVENIIELKETQDKIKNTSLRKGYEHPAKNKITRLKMINSRYNNKVSNNINYEKVNNILWLKEQYKTKSCNEIAKEIGCVSGITISRKFIKHGIDKYIKYHSYIENELYDYLKNELLIVDIIRNTKKLIHPLEIDIYLPDYKLAIEIDGIHWHKEQNGKDKNYHLNKTKLCEEKGIQLLHIFENEWIEKREVWKSIIRNKLGKNNNKIFARKCEIKEVSSKESNIFLNNNHLQGSDRASIRIGLYYENNLVSLLTVGKSRYNKKFEYEILRFCSLLNTNVVGGFNKLLKYFKLIYKPKSIITYADKRYSNGNLYNNNLTFSHISLPNYFYVINNKLSSRIQYQKHLLKEKLQNFNENLTEYENMLNNGYDRIWDCGNLVYISETINT